MPLAAVHEVHRGKAGMYIGAICKLTSLSPLTPPIFWRSMIGRSSLTAYLLSMQLMVAPVSTGAQTPTTAGFGFGACGAGLYA